MKVKMRIHLIAPHGTYLAGEIVDLETDTAQRLIAENTAEAVPEEAYSSWPREGCTLAEALKRTTDADLLAAAALAEQKLAGAGGRRWPPHFIPFAFDDDDGFYDWKTSPADHQNAQFREAADKARAAIVDGFYRLLFDQRLVTLGCFETSSAPPRVMTPRAWKSITVRSWRLSIARERTPKAFCWYDVRVFPAVLAPNAEEILADRPLCEAFQRFVLEDPEVVALRQPALKVAPQLKPVFLSGLCQPYGREEWPVVFERCEIARLIHPDRQQSPIGDPGEPDSPIVTNAVDALVDRYNALMALLRRGKPRRQPRAEAVAKALKAIGLEQRPASLTLKSIASIIAPELPKPPKTEHDLQTLTKAIERYYRSKET